MPPRADNPPRTSIVAPDPPGRRTEPVDEHTDQPVGGDRDHAPLINAEIKAGAIG